MKEASTDRKRHESRVRAVLKGHHVVTCDEVFEKVVEAERASRKRQVRKGRRSEARSDSPSNKEDISPINDSQASVRETGDCIVVQI